MYHLNYKILGSKIQRNLAIDTMRQRDLNHKRLYWKRQKILVELLNIKNIIKSYLLIFKLIDMMSKTI